MTRMQANGLLLLAGAMWGMGFVAQSTAMGAIGPLLFIGLRFLAASLSVAPFAILEARKAQAPIDRHSWIAFGIIGLLLFAGMVAQQFGLLTTSVTNSGFLTGLYVVLVPIVSVLAFRVYPHPVIWPAAIVALAGIFLLSGGRLSALTTGDWLTILCAFIWAFQLVLISRHAGNSGRPVTLALSQFVVCAVLGLSAAIIFEPIDVSAIRQAMPEILYTGIFSGALAFTLQAVGQRYTSSSQAAILLASEALFAAIFGAWFLGERVGAVGLVGCGLIFAAIVAVEAIPPLTRRKASTRA